MDGETAARSESPESVLTTASTVEMEAPKKRIARPLKPNRASFEAEISKLSAIPMEHQARITEIKAIVNAKRDRRKASSTANAPLLEKVKALNAIANEKIAQRDAIREELRASDEKRITFGPRRTRCVRRRNSSPMNLSTRKFRELTQSWVTRRCRSPKKRD